MNDWLAASIAIAAGFVLGSIAARIIRQLIDREGNPERLRETAPALASLVFSAFLVAGLVVALGFVKRDALDQLADDAVDYLPRLLSAVIVVIIGNVAGTIASSAVRQALGRASGKVSEQVPGLVKMVILGFAAILAAAQIGVDTTVINIAVSALLFGISLSLALLVGMGGAPIAREIAAGRALRRLVRPGDEIASDSTIGRVLTVHSTAIELDIGGESMLVPNSEVAQSRMAITRNEAADETDA